MPIPKILHLTSRSVPLEGFERRLLQRNIPRLPAWDIRVHSDADNDRMVEDFFPGFIDVYRRLPHGVMRADIARLVYMHAFGGWYADTDYEWLRDPSGRSERVVLPLSRDDRIGNAVFGSVPGAAVWSRLLGTLFDQPDLLAATKDRVEALTGPEFITSRWEDLRRDDDIWFAPRELFHAPVTEAGETAFGVHHTAGSWRERPLAWRAGVARRWATRALRRVLGR